LNKSTIYPFIPLQVEEQNDVELIFDIEQFNSIVGVKEIWCPVDTSIPYSNWITEITKHLLGTLPDFCKSLLPIAENKVKTYEYWKCHIFKFITLTDEKLKFLAHIL